MCGCCTTGLWPCFKFSPLTIYVALELQGSPSWNRLWWTSSMQPTSDTTADAWWDRGWSGAGSARLASDWRDSPRPSRARSSWRGSRPVVACWGRLPLDTLGWCLLLGTWQHHQIYTQLWNGERSHLNMSCDKTYWLTVLDRQPRKLKCVPMTPCLNLKWI